MILDIISIDGELYFNTQRIYVNLLVLGYQPR
jgi:hypothetical protein